MKYSTTFAGLLVIIAGWLDIADIITSDNAAIIIDNVLQLIGIIVAIYGRFKAGGVNLLGFKKSV